jgi:hypothetical protein
MDVSAKSAFKDIFWLYFHTLWAFTNLMAYLCTIIADVVLRVVLGELLEELLGSLKVFFHEDLGVIVRAFGTFLTESIHVVPAELTDDMLELTGLPVKAESHIEIGTALINMSKRAVLAFLALFPHKIRTNFEVMTEIAFVSVPTSAHTLEFITRFYFAFVVRMRAVVRQPALSVDKFLTDSIGGELIMVWSRGWLLSGSRSIVQRIVISWIGALLLLWVHYNNIKL